MIEGGTIAKVGEAAALLPTLAPGTPVDHYPDQLVLPGLIDTHLHFPQTQVIASYGAQLLEWLQKYTFVEEQKFAEPDHARRVAGFFMDELLRNGTTTAVVYCSVHAELAEAFFAESHKRNTRMIAGKVMMDRGAPPGLLDTAQRGYDETKALIGRWHGQRRQLYAISPRFALTSTEAQLEASGALVREHPDCYVQTHLAENHDEIATARRLYPAAASYTDIYDRYGLLGPRSLFGHCIHLDEPELERLVGHSLDRRLLPDLEPVHRQRPVRSGDDAESQAAGAGEPCHRRRRRHQLLDAAHRRRGLQGAAAPAPEPAGASTPST